MSGADPTGTRPAGRRWLAGLGVTAAFLLLFGPTLLHLGRDWFTDPEYGHGLLLLPVALYLAWRARLPAALRRPEPGPGSLALVGALVLFWVGTVAGEHFTMRVSVLVALAGLALFHAGRRQLRAWWLPFALLAFTIPLPAVALNSLTLPLQLLASEVAVEMLRFRHVPALVEGNIIRLPEGDLFVAEACSGLRSLSALFGLTLLIGGTGLERWRSRTVLLALALPAALAANALRVFATGYGSYYLGLAPETGAGHEGLGIAVFLSVLAVVALAALALRAWERRRGAVSAAGSGRGRVSPGSGHARGGARGPGGIAGVSAAPAPASLALLLLPAALLLLGRAGTAGLQPERSLALAEPLDSLPERMAGYESIDRGSVDPASMAVLRPDDYLLRRYAPTGLTPATGAAEGATSGGRGDRPVTAGRDARGFELFVAYYGRQLGGTSIHSPRNCLPGAGWEPTRHERVPLATSRGPGEVNRYLIQGPAGRRALVYYWYQGRGRIAANEYRVKWDLLRDALVKRRTDEALVRLIFPLDPVRGAGPAGAARAATREASLGALALPPAPGMEGTAAATAGGPAGPVEGASASPTGGRQATDDPEAIVRAVAEAMWERLPEG